MFVDRAAGIVGAIGSARSRRAFLAAVEDFERMLALVPDYPGTFFTAADYEVLSALGDLAIGYVQARLTARTDRAAVQRHLAATIDRLRVAMEEVDLRLHQTAAGNPPRHGPGALVVSPYR